MFVINSFVGDIATLLHDGFCDSNPITAANIGMHTMEQRLSEFVKNGSLSLDAAMTYAYDPQDLQRILSKNI